MSFYLRTVAVWPSLPSELGRLKELAYNLWWTWQPEAQELIARPDPGLWEAVGHNPVAAILRLPPGALMAAADAPEYRELYARVTAAFDRYMAGPTWFEQRYPDARQKTVAYFSAEFGLHECLPIYSGGLGLLAGDHCKAASDLGLPLVGVGILYKHGYFTQEIDRDGRQEASYPHLNFAEMPIVPVTDACDQELLVPVELPGRTVYLRVWRAQVGRVPVYLLDADTPKNRPEDRLLTGQLYGGDHETRIAQEILLGIGGVRALRAMGLCPSVWHINEGHAAFSLVERLRELVQQGVAVDTALEAIRSCTLFTTHTPVPAGHDVFTPELVDAYFGRLYTQLGVNRETFLQLGWDPVREGFNMTLLAFRHSSFTNAVSRLHRDTTRRMLAHLYPDVPVEEIPVDAVTNGVHTATWLAPEWGRLFERHLIFGWREDPEDAAHWERVAAIPDREIWETHCRLKAKTLRFVRDRIREQRLRNHEPPARVAEVEACLDPEVLTIGFARRFATYKRATLLLSDLERLSLLVNNPERPVQIVFAGKAHPADRPGQEMIRHIYEIIN
ncbi:MAG: alpha-glucan family phosphorylase, partial [Firmicutes bacterium]|nr:alpha-glucan family phosphorylase [Bacillota bacterium]